MAKKNGKDVLTNLLKGLAMGSADIIPGVSGGTIALITGIYTRLISAIDEIFTIFNTREFLVLFTGGSDKKKEIIRRIDVPLVLPLLIGILVAVFGLSRMISFLVQDHAIATYSFFIGLVLSSAVILASHSDISNLKRILTMTLGFLSGLLLAGIPATFTFEGWTIIFLAGAIAITAMILPGISGSLMILMLGQYERMLQAVSDLNVLKILLFVSGCIVGLGTFSKILNRLMHEHEKSTKSFLVGLMLGSIRYQWDIISLGYGEAVNIAISVIFVVFGIITILILSHWSILKPDIAKV